MLVIEKMSLLETYWFEIAIGAISIIVGIIVAYIFYRLQKKDVGSAEIERRKRAREELLDVIESNIINKQKPTEDFIQNLIAAFEREYKVNLEEICSPITLLQDVSLRLQRSRHLDISQKGTYAEQIETLIYDLKYKEPISPSGIWKDLEALEISLENNQLEKSKEILKTLKAEFCKYQQPEIKNERLSESLLKKSSVIIGSLTSIITLLSLILSLSEAEANNESYLLILIALFTIIPIAFILIKKFLIKYFKFDEGLRYFS